MPRRGRLGPASDHRPHGSRVTLPGPYPIMKPCISQATTLMNPFEADPPSYRERRLDGRRALADQAGVVLAGALGRRGPRAARVERAVRPPRRRGRGACCSRGARNARPTGTTSGAGWRLLQELGVPTLIVAADFAANVGRPTDSRTTPAPPPRWARPPSWPRSFGVRLALEFQKSSPILHQPGHGAGPGRPVRQPQRRGLPRRVPLLHRPEQVRGPRLRLARRPDRLGPALRRERHAPRAGRRRRPDLARRGRFPARADRRPSGADRLRRLRLARAAQPASLAGPRRSRRRPGLPGAPPRPGPVARRVGATAVGPPTARRRRTIAKEGPERVVGGDPPTRSDRVPRGAVLRLAGLRPDRIGRDPHRPRPAAARTSWSQRAAPGAGRSGPAC